MSYTVLSATNVDMKQWYGLGHFAVFWLAATKIRTTNVLVLSGWLDSLVDELSILFAHSGTDGDNECYSIAVVDLSEFKYIYIYIYTRYSIFIY